MAKILLISDDVKTIQELKNITEIHSFEFINVKTYEEAEKNVLSENTDVIIFDSKLKNIIEIIRKIKLLLQTKDVRSIVILEAQNPEYDLLKYTNTYIQMPIDEHLYISTLNSALQLRETFRVLSKNNNDLAKSLYQLNVLYTTSTQ